MTKKRVSLPDEAETTLRAFVDEVDERLSGDEDTYEVVEDVLVDLNGDRDAYESWKNGASVSAAEEARLRNYDPHNVTLESEYYAEKDEEAFEESKPLQWLWRQFDNTPLADNVEFALRFREMLANHLFAEAGEGLRIFKGVSMTYGHNIELGDNVVVHDDVHLDDRGKLELGDRVSIADNAHLYTHDHDVVDQTKVSNYRTVLEDDVRVGQDAMIRAGVRVGENAFAGAKSIVQGDIPAHHVAVGTPAKSVRVKPGWESVAEPLDQGGKDRREQRRIEFDLDLDESEEFDEFDRERTPPN
ncbi:acyltransferase [Halospeciosus flavus]|uniref:Acyltransferase n=1 Tax=Halospeciosus flavus TaxID=3032283 RepID=A0ABD5Z8E7_9EURY|nr:acyltransferase [Halospeciosus flavus]